MADVSTAFNQAANKFSDYGKSVRGYIRYEVTQRNLAKYLSSEPLEVIDVGGGSGIDSLWLAQLGHRVTLAEPAKEQRELAEKRFSKLPSGVRDRIKILPGTVPELLKAGHSGLYDLILSHGVAMYMDEPEVFVKDLVKLAKPKGCISLLEKGYFGKEAHLVLKQNWEDLQKLYKTQKMVNNMGHNAWSFYPEQLNEMLVKAGASVIDWSGVRMVSDWMEFPVDDLKPEQLDLLVAAEVRQGHHHGTRALGQMLHFIAQKTA